MGKLTTNVIAAIILGGAILISSFVVANSIKDAAQGINGNLGGIAVGISSAIENK